jgi:peroxiredoxin
MSGKITAMTLEAAFLMSRSYKAAGLLLAVFFWAPTVLLAGDTKLIGTQAKEWDLTDWVNSKPLTLKDLRGKVVLVRWWTGPGCRFCSATAPSLKEFDSRYASRGLVVLGVYHHKGLGPLKLETVKQCVRDLGFEFPVAVDPEWKTLKRWWLTSPDRKWTSVTFLLDRKGIIRHIHPGGSYVKGDEAYQAMQDKIEGLLKEE